MYTLNLSRLSKYLLLIIFPFLGMVSHAQHTQHTQRCIPYMSSMVFEKWLNKKVDAEATKRITAEIINIPVVVHIIHNGEAVGVGANISKAQIESQIRILNEDFRKKLNTNGHNTHPAGADIEINFQLAVQSPDGIPTDGIVRVNGGRESWGFTNGPTMKALSFWNPDHYLNVWVCNLPSLLGYAQFPETDVIGVPQNDDTKNPLTDGIVVHYQAFGDTGSVSAPYDKGRTATHEVGHYLGLLHVSGDGACPTDDFCFDTPPVNGQTQGCPSAIPIACNGEPSQIENYMDYTDDRCMNMFTEQQKIRMRTVLANSPRRKTLKDSPGLQLVNLIANNAGIASITQVQNSTCDTEVIPRVLIRNFGNNPLTSVTITYNIDGEAPQTLNWQGNLASLDTVTVQLPTTQTTRADHQLNVETSLPNGQVDTDIVNNTKSVNFTVQALNTLPLEYDFADTTILNTQWQIINPDEKETWMPIIVPEQSQGRGNNAMILPYFDYSDIGQEDQLITPLLDVSAAPQLLLEFRVAYAPFRGDESSRDGLKIGVSTDCGQTFTIVYEKYGDTLATDDPASDNWKPIRANQWRTEIINLSKWAGKGNIQLGFIGVNDYGNNIYIDDINLTSDPLSTNPDDFIVVTPNPTINQEIRFNLRLPSVTNTLDWALYDLSGKNVKRGQVTNAQFQTVTIPAQSQLRSGVYILKVSTPQYTVTKRVLVF
ncbi:MAG TPA: hypothetical protein DCS93_11545 [Microscillaceae bacterium]|nr:hypothetical protein [Microscillaceae bacterium]